MRTGNSRQLMLVLKTGARMSRVLATNNVRKQFALDAIGFTFSAFGGPQAHLAVMLRLFVAKRGYLSESELFELNALAQVLPGPTSSQTLVGVAYKIGGLFYAIGIYLIWLLPSAVIMCLAALFFKSFEVDFIGTKVLEYVESMAVGFVAFAAFSLFKRSVKGPLFYFLAILSTSVCLWIQRPIIFPILIVVGGFIASVLQAGKEEKAISTNLLANINPRKLVYFVGIFMLFAALGGIINRTSPFSLPVRLFQNLYRNGVFIYGGGQVLVPYLFTEFVVVKHYLTSGEFLSGYAMQQALPGPTFSFISFVGAMTMANAGYHFWGQIGGSFLAVIALNSPGLILMLFIVPFWEELKKMTHVRNSISGIHAVSAGFIMAAMILLTAQLPFQAGSLFIAFLTFLLLSFTTVPAPVLVIAGICCGIFIT